MSLYILHRKYKKCRCKKKCVSTIFEINTTYTVIILRKQITWSFSLYYYVSEINTTFHIKNYTILFTS